MFKNSIRIACENDQISLAKQSLKYMSSNEIVHIPSTKIRIGKMNLIVGPSGSGKSTILNALVESAGELSKVLGRFAYVPQQNEFFDGTVIENITLFDENPNEKLLKEIFSVCAIDQFLTRQEAQDTFITNKAKLSGGQLQRIALARAIYSQPSVLILDEPTTGLEYSLDVKIFKNLKTYLSGTLIFTSHTKYDEEFWDCIVKL